ncbi:hypothetical protein C2S51_023862 [Perilla frutescens var. frutescens]|nr:hypothetical protein C2S51_023862 [Perilla frutescens var. frutescens]
MGRSSTAESEDGVLSADSPLSNDGDNFGGSSNGGVVLKKGPWTSAEDSILVEYVKKHGEGNWNAVQKHTGLARCGKSCRLRWANHLRPNLKKGAFTSEEERLIIELHAKMGNKWARMAAHLPGRTDNEIKNYWNTRIKRRQRAGLPLYPPDLCLQSLPENQQQLSSPRIYGGDKSCHDILQSNGYRAPDIMFDSFNILAYTPEIPGIPTSISMGNGFASPQSYSFVHQTMGMPERAQEPDEPMSDYGSGAVNEAPAFNRTRTDSCVNKSFQSFGLCFPYDPDHTKKLLSSGVNQETPFMSFSASEHFADAQKSELPSLQYQETGLGVWDPQPESFDSLVQSPPLSGPLPSHCPSPGSSGLLEDLIYEAKSLGKSENQSSGWATSSNVSHGEIKADGSALRTCSPEFKGYIDPNSPSGNSMGSFFNRYTPTIGRSLENDMTMHHVKSEAFDPSWIVDGESKVDYSRPDAILGSCWVKQGSPGSKQKGPTADSNAARLGDNLGTNTSASASTWGFSSCSWNNMPAVCQMSDIP